MRLGINFFTFAYFLALSTTAIAKVTVEYRISPVHGLVKFVYAVAGEPHQSGNLKEIFNRSSYKTREIHDAIEVVQRMSSGLHRGIEFNTISFEDRADGMEVASFIAAQSIFASSLKELGERTVGIMPLSEHTQFFAALQRLEPVYKKLIWDKSIKQLRLHQQELEKLARRANLNQMFAQAKNFYRSSWPENLNFIIGLYPILHLKEFENSSSSSSFGSVEEHGVMIGGRAEEEVAGSFGVIFHELCHSLYGAQDVSFIEELNGYFTSSQSPYQLQAHTWFNEAVATTIGNGWAYGRAKPKKADEHWYNNVTVDTYAKAIYPLTKAYIEDGKSIDKSYIDMVIQLFAEALPDAIYTYESILNRVVVLSDQQVKRDLTSELRKNFFISSLASTSQMDVEKAFELFNDRSLAVIFIFSDKGWPQLKPHAKASKFVEQNLEKLKKMKTGSVLSGIEDGRPIIFIKSAGKDDLVAALAKMKAKKKIDREGKEILD